MRACRTIFLTGAPTCRNLRWDETELLDGPVPPFYTEQQQQQDVVDQRQPVTHAVKWRLLQNGTTDTLFLTTTDLQPAGVGSSTLMDHAEEGVDNDDDLSRFYHHSFAIHESFDVSGETQSFSDSSAGGASTGEGDTLPLSPVKRQPSAAPPIIRGPVSNVISIPNAKYLDSIVPQTMTVNLVVAVLEVRPPRRVVTRQWKKDLDIVELVVGDDTRTGFGVTFWLHPGERGGGMAQNLPTLRPWDIVLLRTVALGSFGERVYGQSLRKGTTQVDLLHRRPVDWTDGNNGGGLYGVGQVSDSDDVDAAGDVLLAKVRRVHEWIVRFVGYPTETREPHGRKRRHQDMLPPDTQ